MSSRDGFLMNELHYELGHFHALPLASHMAHSVDCRVVEVIVVLSDVTCQLALLPVGVGNPILLRLES
jgi:hypothetical protein